MEVFVTVVGATFRPAEAKEIIKRLTIADGNKLSLEAEPENPHDCNAVKVICEGQHIGYLARENNWEVAQGLEAGEEFDIEIVGFENTLKPTLLITLHSDDELTAEDMGEYPGDR